MLKIAEMSEEEKLRKRELADKMAKKRAKTHAIITNFVVFVPILLVALGIRATGNTAGFWSLAGLGILIAIAFSWGIKERCYNKYYRIYLQELFM